MFEGFAPSQPRDPWALRSRSNRGRASGAELKFRPLLIVHRRPRIRERGNHTSTIPAARVGERIPASILKAGQRLGACIRSEEVGITDEKVAPNPSLAASLLFARAPHMRARRRPEHHPGALRRQSRIQLWRCLDRNRLPDPKVRPGAQQEVEPLLFPSQYCGFEKASQSSCPPGLLGVAPVGAPRSHKPQGMQEALIASINWGHRQRVVRSPPSAPAAARFAKALAIPIAKWCNLGLLFLTN